MKAIAFAAIAFFVLLAYSPSFMHVPRADQIMYLSEVAGKKTWWDLTVGSMDLNRHRAFNPGDEILFRPVVYFWLGSERYFFGYNFLLWQAAGILLHLGVLWSLLRLLLAIHTGWPAVLFTAFFSVLFVNMEMVVWHHINSYMLFVICILAALRRCYLILNGQKDRPKDYAVLFLWLVIAAFTYELANVIALAMAIVLWCLKPQQRWWSFCLVLVPLLYAAASLLNARMHPFTFTQSLPTAFATGPVQAIGNWFYAMGAWFYAGLFPGELEWVLGARNMIAPNETHLIKFVHVTQWPTLLALAAAGTYGVCIFKNKQVPFSPPRVLAGLALILVLTFAGLIAAGRGSRIIMWDVLRVNTYYMYMFWVFLLAGLYAWVDWSSTGIWRKRLLCVFTAGLMLYNAGKLYAANEEQARGNNDILVLVRTIDMLIKEHGQEPGFSFYVDARYPGNYVYTELRRWNDPLNRRYSFIEALYPQYFTTNSPKYKFLTRPSQ